MIDVYEWDNFVMRTYGRPYNFQQQGGCKSRGIHQIEVPNGWAEEEEQYYKDNEVKDHVDVINGQARGVTFAYWLARDPNQPLVGQKHSFELSLWWERHFYPDVDMIANDLHARGLLEAGEYIININW